jgi:hypothetical protein
VRLWRRWTMPTAYVRVMGGAETDEQAIERYWREHPSQDGCRVETIRRVYVKPDISDPLAKQRMRKNSGSRRRIDSGSLQPK